MGHRPAGSWLRSGCLGVAGLAALALVVIGAIAEITGPRLSAPTPMDRIPTEELRQQGDNHCPEKVQALHGTKILPSLGKPTGLASKP